VVLNQSTAVPVLITARVKGQSIADVAADKFGAVLYCRVEYDDGTIDYCPTTNKTKNVGTFHWRYLGVNTANLNRGYKRVKSIEVAPMLGAVEGSVWFDDIHVREYHPLEFRGAVTLMFDDGFKEHFTVALPALESYCYKGVEAAVVNYLGSGDPAYMNLAELKLMRDAGWEVVSHGMSHSNMVALNTTAMEDEYYWSRRYFLDNGFGVKTFVLPFGEYNALVLGLNNERGYYSSIRKVERGFNPAGAFPYDIKIQEIKAATTMSEINAWLNEAVTRRKWLVIVMHKIRDMCRDEYCVSIPVFNNMLMAVQSSTLPVLTYEQGLDAVRSPR
jgi:peptidoglycan/xylan/chitin deacetylase (PgdA/CDA1 family)